MDIGPGMHQDKPPLKMICFQGQTVDFPQGTCFVGPPGPLCLLGYDPVKATMVIPSGKRLHHYGNCSYRS